LTVVCKKGRREIIEGFWEPVCTVPKQNFKDYSMVSV